MRPERNSFISLFFDLIKYVVRDSNGILVLIDNLIRFKKEALYPDISGLHSNIFHIGIYDTVPFCVYLRINELKLSHLPSSLVFRNLLVQVWLKVESYHYGKPACQRANWTTFGTKAERTDTAAATGPAMTRRPKMEAISLRSRLALL